MAKNVHKLFCGKYVSIAIILFVLHVCSGCKYAYHDEKILPPAYNSYVSYLSAYYGEPKDTVVKYYVFEDSILVPSSGMKVYHFYDSRNAHHGADGVADYAASKLGILVQSCWTGNINIWSRNAQGRFRKGVFLPYNLYMIPNAFMPDEYFDREINDPLAMYSLPQSGLSSFLNTILNDMPQTTRSEMNRTKLDTLFRAILFPVLRGGDVALVNSKDDRYVQCCEICNDMKKSYSYYQNEKSERFCQLFFEYVKNNSEKENFFIYNRRSEFIKGFATIITVNEGMKGRFLDSANKFYQEFDNEPILFNIKIYSPLYFAANSKP